jgi:hypothetical protein
MLVGGIVAAIVLVGAGLGVAVLASGGDNGDGAPAPTTERRAATGPESGGEPEPCTGAFDVLTAGDIQELAGVTAGTGTREPESGGGCIFEVGDGLESTLLAEVYHVDNADFAATQFEQYREAYDEEDVAGLGDEAIYDSARHALAARGAEFTVVLTYSGSDEAVTREALVALASIAFERLGAG